MLSASELRNNSACQMDRKGSGVPLIISGSGADGGGRVVVLEMMVEIALWRLASKLESYRKLQFCSMVSTAS